METIVQFGPEGRLVGLLSGKPGPDAAATLVLLNAGMFPRSGPFRLHVEIARRLAPLGIPVFRFDLPGIGEAPHLPASTDLEAISAALDRLAEQYGCTSFVVGGVCSAADLGWRMAAADRRVSGVVLLDGLCFAGPWFWLARLWLALRRPRQWPGMMQRLVNRVRAPGTVPVASDFRDWPTRSQARVQLQDMLARNVRLLFVYTGGAADRFLHWRQFAWAFGKAGRSDNVALHFWPGCDHLFYLKPHRDRLIETVALWLQRP